MTIKHIVLGGGGPIGIVSYGVIKQLILKKIIIYNQIKSIYSTSIGCLIALIFLLNLEYDWIDDFIIKRPWQNVWNFSTMDYINLFFTKGLCDENIIINCLKPLFLAADIDINITLKEFYNINKIEWNIITSNLNKFTKVTLNHKTHPDLKIIQAIIMSSSIPILIKPPFYNNEYYLDGGIFSNNPINDCYLNQNCHQKEIIALINDKRKPTDLNNNYYTNLEKEIIQNDISNNNLNQNTNIISFVIYIIKTVFKKFMIIENENSININNVINVCLTSHNIDINYWNYVFNNPNERERLINHGIHLANKFINNYNYNYFNKNTNIQLYNDISFNLNSIKPNNFILIT